MPGIPHHITQRGNRRQQTFFCEEDYAAYIKLLAVQCHKHEVEIWSYCLMPNHIHLIAVPKTSAQLRLAIGEAHRVYTKRINKRMDWRGYLWQGRFASVAMDQTHLIAAAKYVELNPVTAGLVDWPEKWKWSSARAHLSAHSNVLVNVEPLLEIIPDWNLLFDRTGYSEEWNNLKKGELTGRPQGNKRFLRKIEQKLGRSLIRKKPGPKRRL